ncbi:hypothetical protein ACFXJ8_37400 [Nonomuraea sp. NPDC059194]|uniref:helix-turn-helix transcriptional regulator n=1 Tax=Nonomuraea sp. NPDC059194 TaxID=3346764 RepID=UPI0036BAA8AC
MAIAELKALGLIDDALLPARPDAVLDRLVRRRMEEAARDLQQIGALWETVRDLGSGDRRFEMVERIEGMAAVQARLSATRRKESLNVKKAPIGSKSSYNDDTSASFTEKLASGMTSRTIVPADSLADPDQLEYARRMTGLGDLHRVVTGHVRPFFILDRATAFVRIDPSDGAPGALVIRQPGVVATFVDLFEHLWASGRDLDEQVLTALERQVLSALATFSKDELAARAVHVSVRKYRTHVADLMARLGASSRFQAALLARERGWI